MGDCVDPPVSCKQLLARMIGFDTVNGCQSGRVEAERLLAEYLASVAGQWGLATQFLAVPEHAPNLLVTHEVSATGPWLLFDSHLDTVDVVGMTIDPFGGKIKGEGRDAKIYGRGACDTKGTGAAMLWALRQYAADGNGATNIAILFSVDEEVGAAGAQAFADVQHKQLDWAPAGVVVGEPTMMELIAAANGVVRWQIQTTGVAVHSSAPERGRSAISDMLRVVDALESKYISGLDAEHELTGKARCSVNMIHGGVQINIVPESCTIDIDRRLVPGEDGCSVLPAVERILNPLRTGGPGEEGVQVDQKPPWIIEPLDPAPGLRFAGQVSAVLARHGFDAKPSGVGYGTNGNVYSPVGIPTVVLGPGHIDQTHTKDEWLGLDQLRAGVKGYYSLMAESAEAWK